VLPASNWPERACFTLHTVGLTTTIVETPADAPHIGAYGVNGVRTAARKAKTRMIM
jgi:hypothetical protein